MIINTHPEQNSDGTLRYGRVVPTQLRKMSKNNFLKNAPEMFPHQFGAILGYGGGVILSILVYWGGVQFKNMSQSDLKCTFS